MTFKIIHNLDPNSHSKLITDFSTGDPLLPSYCSSTASQIHNADLRISITGCKLVPQLPSPACRRVLFYLCVLCVCFFFNEPTFKNLEISHNSYSGISWKISQSGNIRFHPHVAIASLEEWWGVSRWMKHVPLSSESPPCLSSLWLWGYVNFIYYQTWSIIFLTIKGIFPHANFPLKNGQKWDKVKYISEKAWENTYLCISKSVTCK